MQPKPSRDGGGGTCHHDGAGEAKLSRAGLPDTALGQGPVSSLLSNGDQSCLTGGEQGLLPPSRGRPGSMPRGG